MNFLVKKFEYFEKKGTLNRDGSLYYDDKRFSKELGCSERTISRARKYWANAGYIKFDSVRFRTKATKYWLIKKPDKMSTYGTEKYDNLSQKPDNMSQEDRQNVTPNAFNNKEFNKVGLKLKDQKFLNIYDLCSKDVGRTKRMLRREGFSEYQIEEAFYRNNKKESVEA